MTGDGSASPGPAQAWRPWYHDGGARFACARCGNCCSGKGAVVVVSPREVEALARLRGTTAERFRAEHTQERFGDTVLRDREDGRCEWLVRNEDGTTACSVQDAKPDQCRAYPFWPRVLRSRETWEDEGKRCHGIGRGPDLSGDEIDRRTGRAAVAAALDLLLEELDEEVRDLGTVCWLSGDCCDFPVAGHRLYATRIEAERFARGIDLSGWDPASGLCPAWRGGRCTAREHRPSACRTYFCDPEAEERVQDLTERTITRLRWLHEKHGLPWEYGEWTTLLAALRDAGARPRDVAAGSAPPGGTPDPSPDDRDADPDRKAPSPPK